MTVDAVLNQQRADPLFEELNLGWICCGMDFGGLNCGKARNKRQADGQDERSDRHTSQTAAIPFQLQTAAQARDPALIPIFRLQNAATQTGESVRFHNVQRL